MPTRAVVSGSLLLLLAGCTAPRHSVTAGPAPHAKEARLSQLHLNRQDGWSGAEGAQAELAQEHLTGRGAAIKANLPPGAYPTLAYASEPQDWSAYDALRFHVFSEAADLKLSYRVDNAGSKDFATRYQSDLPLRVAKGDNDLEICVGALRQGNLFSRGLDVSQIKSLRFFVVGLKEPAALYFSDFRFVRRSGKPREVAMPTKVGLEAHEGTRIALNVKPSLDLTLDITGGPYPGVTLSKFDPDFLQYDLLTLRLTPVQGRPMPDNISVKIVDRSGRAMTFSTQVAPDREGKADITLPVELASQLSLGQIAELNVFFENAAGKATNLQVFFKALDRVDAPTVHTDALQRPGLALDFKPLAALGKNSVWMALLAIPLRNGQVRFVRCNSDLKGNVLYQVPASIFEQADERAPVQVWAYLTEHGIWNFQHLTVEQPLPATIRFEDAKKFNH
jgi:hypothetical protein